MALGARAAPFTYVAHALAVVAAVMVLVWCIQFRGGLAFEDTNKNLIFNLHPVLMLIGYIILGSEVYTLGSESEQFVCMWIFGFIAFFFPGAAPNVRKGVLPWHILFGLFVYILALATAELGFLEKLTFLQSSGLDKYGAEAFLVNFTALVVVLFGASVVVAAIAPARLEEPHDYAPLPED
ncbi:hypothetical protein PR202_ga02135 [Eleusine coracana subsp. coracana]|uniref:Cytochrome b561 domain-containing protein n=1 Tax=Eleusine coracana subsp. coracana TaxID=191504 RepID=A0AAV5BH03_ELECO|nr:hypothetical protein PR202_ga01448 [Eleusine coracana subsp. coracana]GJM86290.1 hypothetical protein PR202_ga02135 [Eleusine coracana subsp. coracana]